MIFVELNEKTTLLLKNNHRLKKEFLKIVAVDVEWLTVLFPQTFQNSFQQNCAHSKSEKSLNFKTFVASMSSFFSKTNTF